MMRAVVYKFRDVHTHQAVPIPPGEHVIGREDACAVHIENTSVSRRHAKIVNDESGVWIEDLGSSNGTAMHGQPITGRTAIAVDDVVYFGTACYRLEPEVAGEVALEPVPQTGLKPAGLRNLMRKTTDRVPLGSIRFDDVPAAVPFGAQAAPVAAAEPVTAAAVTDGVTAVKSAAREKISTYPTITLPTSRPQTRIAAPTPASVSPSPASVVVQEAPVPVTHRQTEAVSAPVAAHVTAEVDAVAAVSWKLTLWLAFGSGVAVGILAGIGIAYYLFAAAKAAV